MEPSGIEIIEFLHRKLRSSASPDGVQVFRSHWRHFCSCRSHEKPKLRFRGVLPDLIWASISSREHFCSHLASSDQESSVTDERSRWQKPAAQVRGSRSRVRKAKTISTRPTTIAKTPMNGAREGRSEPARTARIAPK